MNWLGIILMAVVLAVAPGYSGAEQSAPKAGSPAAQTQDVGAKGKPALAVKNYTPEERQAYEKKAAADLDKLQQRLNDLNEQKVTAASQRRPKVRTVVGLQKQVFAIRNQLEVLKKAPENEWSGLKDGLDKGMKALNKNFDAVESGLQ